MEQNFRRHVVVTINGENIDLNDLDDIKRVNGDDGSHLIIELCAGLRS